MGKNPKVFEQRITLTCLEQFLSAAVKRGDVARLDAKQFLQGWMQRKQLGGCWNDPQAMVTWVGFEPGER